MLALSEPTQSDKTRGDCALAWREQFEKLIECWFQECAVDRIRGHVDCALHGATYTIQEPRKAAF